MVLLKVISILLLINAAYCHLSCRLSSSNDQEQFEDEDIIITGRERKTSSKALVGPPGKQGPRGPPGDVTKCNCPVDHHQQQLISGLERSIAELQKIIACNGVVYKDFCIRLLYTRGPMVPRREDAAEQCRSNGGTLVEIRDDQLFYDVYSYIKKAWIAYTGSGSNGASYYVNIWLGMKYKNNNIVFDNGDVMSTDSVGFWRKNTPYSNADRIYIALHVAMTQASVDDGNYGLFNVHDSWPNPVPLCQFPL